MHSPPAQRLGSTRIHRDIVPPNGCQDTACISCCLVERGIAMDGADAEKV